MLWATLDFKSGVGAGGNSLFPVDRPGEKKKISMPGQQGRIILPCYRQGRKKKKEDREPGASLPLIPGKPKGKALSHSKPHLPDIRVMEKGGRGSSACADLNLFTQWRRGGNTPRSIQLELCSKRPPPDQKKERVRTTSSLNSCSRPAKKKRKWWLFYSPWPLK